MTEWIADEVMVWNLPATLQDFPNDPNRVKGVMGPVGSAKTVTCFPMDVLHKACLQKRSPKDGIRYSREVIVRSSEPRLKSTTIKTFLEWMKPEQFGGTMRWDPPIEYHARWAQVPGDIVDLTVWFIPAEDAKDAEKLKSLEVGRCRLNEATEVHHSVFDMLRRRQNRYPKKEHGHCTDPGVIMDFNPPHPEHWLYKLMNNVPPGFRFWTQPPAVVEDPNGDLVSAQGTHYRVNTDGVPELNILPADNLENLDPRYYGDQVNGADDSDIRVLLMNQFGFIQDGAPVHKFFRDGWHYPGQELIVYDGYPVLTGWDFGAAGKGIGLPAVVFAQFSPKGQLRVLAELPTEGYISLPAYLDQIVLPFIATRFPWMLEKGKDGLPKNSGWGDPAGRAGEGHKSTAFDELRQRGLNISPAPDFQNLFSTRIKALDAFISATIDGNHPALIINRECTTIRGGLAGQYKIAKILHGMNRDTFKTAPVKNVASHICEALQYLALGIRGNKDESAKQRALQVSAIHASRHSTPGFRPAGY